MQWQPEISELEKALSREKEALGHYQRLMQGLHGFLRNPRRAQPSTKLAPRESSPPDVDSPRNQNPSGPYFHQPESPD